MIDPWKDLGPTAQERLKRNRAWMLARFVDELIYNGATGVFYSDNGGKPDSFGYAKFTTSAGPYGFADLAKELGLEGGRPATEKIIRYVMHELERVAVKECT